MNTLTNDIERSTLSLAATANSAAQEVTPYSRGSLQISWTGLDAFNGTIILEGSNDGTNWNELGGADAGITLDENDDSQIWEFTEFSTVYVRAAYKANNVTTGTATLVWSLYV